MTTQRFALPDVGEGLTEAEVVAWRVAVGDAVAVNDVLVEVETAKSVVELPSPFAGVVTDLLVEEGATVAVGTALIAVGDGPGTPVEPAPPATPGGADESAPAGQAGSGVEGGAEAPAHAEHEADRQAVLVGYGVREGAPVRRRRRGAAATASAGPATAPPEPAPAAGEGAAPARALAKPPVRALARDLGIDLRTVPGTGAGGVVTRDDLLAVTSEPAAPARAATAKGSAAGAGPDLLARTAGETAWRTTTAATPRMPQETAARGAGRATSGVLDPQARTTRVPVRGVRRATAEQMVASAFTAPHATVFTTVDVTRTMKLIERLRADREFRDVHVSPLLFVARAVCLAVSRHPGINASWDEVAQEIVFKHYVNLGIAVATPRGLLVPSVKDADRLPLHRLALALTELVRTARDGRSSPGDLSGSTISITNIGVFGVDSGTPILNPGEAAILCIGAVTQRPWVHKGKIKPRWVAELSVSFDHRLVDGDLGSQFLADVAAVLERPDTAIRWG